MNEENRHNHLAAPRRDPSAAAEQREAALRTLQGQLEPFLRHLRALVRRRRAAPLRGKVDTYGIGNSAFNALVLGVADQKVMALGSAEDIKRLLTTIVMHKLYDEVRQQPRLKRAAGRQRPLPENALDKVADLLPTPTDLP